MNLTRRTLLAGLAASLAFPAQAEPDFPMVPDAGFDKWVAHFRTRASDSGISDRTLNAAFAQAGFLPGVIDKDRNQVEFNLSLEDYLAITCSDARIKAGRAALQKQRRLLAQIEAAYAVEAHVVAAIWGVESFYGTKRGTVPTISALATLAYEGRRADFFEGQLIAALKILQRGDVAPQNMTGGWAGAMGHTQFIPTTYAAFAVDFRGDGRRDIWSDDPTDALASAAHYLMKSGWTHGQPWGYEVQVPPGTSSKGRRSTADWAALGLRKAGGARLTDHGTASLIPPAEGSGPAFLTFRNFSVIGRYNAAQKYMIAVGHLSDRINGFGALIAPFPPDQFGLRQGDRIALQKRLTRLGYDTGGDDGVFGPKTRSAIAGFQQHQGLAPTGNPSLDLLSRMR